MVLRFGHVAAADAEVADGDLAHHVGEDVVRDRGATCTESRYGSYLLMAAGRSRPWRFGS